VTETIVGPASFRRREEVLRAAARLFFDRGYAATSTADIARALGLQRGSVYYYLSTKEDLLYELVRDRYASGTALLERLRNDPRDAPTKLRRLIEEHVVEIAENLVPSALALNESRSLSADRRRAIAAEEAAYQDGVAALIAAGQSDGTIRDDVDPRLVTMAVLGTINWMHRWYDEGRGGSARTIARQFATVFTHGLEATPSTTTDLLDRLEAQARRIAELEARLADD
jgi:TetR/AcrR family transcriptional regulator, cholesterol catabolism regulator